MPAPPPAPRHTCAATPESSTATDVPLATFPTCVLLPLAAAPRRVLAAVPRCRSQSPAQCPHEWFHYACVDLSAPPTGEWMCPPCTKAAAAAAAAAGKQSKKK